MIHIRKGAAIFSQSSATFGKLIRWGQRAPGEKPSRVNHSIVVVEDGDWPAPSLYYEPLIVEADAKTRKGFLGWYHQNDRLVVWDVEMTDEEREIVAREALSKVGRPYGALQLVGQLLDNKLFFGRKVTRRLFRYDPLDICSRVLTESWEKVGIRSFGYGASPDDQDDFLRAHDVIDGRKATCLLDEIGRVT